MSTILLLYESESQVVERLKTTLIEYFGAARVRAGTRVGESICESTIVVALMSDRSSVAGGLPLDHFDRLKEAGLPEALSRGILTIPILLGNAQMPSKDSFPDSLKKAAFTHALPIRTGETFQEDAGRVVSDLENLLGFKPGERFPWDLWLLPLGIASNLLCLPLVVLWYLDTQYWNYDYLQLADYEAAMALFDETGPLWTGACILFLGLVLQYRRHRLYLASRSEFFRAERSDKPTKPDRLFDLARVIAMSALGFGWFAAIPGAILLLLSGLIGGASARKWASVALWLLLAAVCAAWTNLRTEQMGRLAECIDLYEQGAKLGRQSQLDEAEAKFRKAIAMQPNYGNSYLGLANIYLAKQDDEQALVEFGRAIAVYPTRSPGWFWFTPNAAPIQQAYNARADIYSRQGRLELAEEDRVAADAVGSGFLSGMLRLWTF